ncbi:hypothetical protein HT031_005590 [Scenedesmus sp. PABB004]|nr:hypothetical protein HT031_005590 [Scenedesmus sp. PABB004]
MYLSEPIRVVLHDGGVLEDCQWRAGDEPGARSEFVHPLNKGWVAEYERQAKTGRFEPYTTMRELMPRHPRAIEPEVQSALLHGVGGAQGHGLTADQVKKRLKETVRYAPLDFQGDKNDAVAAATDPERLSGHYPASGSIVNALLNNQ